jgi:tetratricopeptide (TPR) repeat protein
MISQVLLNGVTVVSFASPKDFDDWIKGLRASLNSVIRIVAERASTADADDYRLLASELAWLLREADRDGEALQVLDDMLQRYPDDVRPAISKANIYLYSLEEFEEAPKWIDVALERAYRTGFWRREALGDKARILLKLGRGDELSDVLEEIMSLQIQKGCSRYRARARPRRPRASNAHSEKCSRSLQRISSKARRRHIGGRTAGMGTSERRDLT